MKWLFWIAFLLSTAIYLAMLAYTLPVITAEAGGLRPFDMRPLGYSLEEAVAFLASLSDKGRDIYINVQHKLDLAYPALLAITLGCGISLVSPPRFGKWKWLLALTAVPGAIFDYRENFLVAKLLNAPPNTVDAALVAAASRATMAKSMFTALAMLLFLALAAAWFYRRWTKAEMQR